MLHSSEPQQQSDNTKKSNVFLPPPKYHQLTASNTVNTTSGSSSNSNNTHVGRSTVRLKRPQQQLPVNVGISSINSTNATSTSFGKSSNTSLESLLSKLNEEQRRAVCSRNDQVIVMAGPGTGKTSVITYRIFYLVHEMKVDPIKICALTFSKAAANEMKERAGRLDERLKNVTFSTFHSKGLALLRKHKLVKQFYKIADDRTVLSIMSDIIAKHEITEECTPSQMKDCVALVKNSGISPNEVTSKLKSSDLNVSLRYFIPFYQEFEEVLEKRNLLTHEDLIFKIVKILKEKPSLLGQVSNDIEYLLVDEYQDTNDLQYEFTKLLVNKHKRIFCVGDSSTSNILDASFDMLLENHSKDGSNNSSKKPSIESIILDDSKSRLISQKGGGPTITIKEFVTHIEQIKFVVDTIKQEVSNNSNRKYGDFAILSRLNSLLKPYEIELGKHKIPFESKQNENFLKSAWIQVLISYLDTIDSISRGNLNSRSLDHVTNIPDRAIFTETKSALIDCLSNGISVSELIDIIEKRVKYKPSLTLGRQVSFLIAMDNEEKKSVIALLKHLIRMNEMTHSVSSLIRYILDTIDVTSYLKQKYTTNYETCEKDIEEFLRMADKTDTLSTFLQEMNDDDESKNNNVRNGVTLLTMHSSKGLEFEYVFVTDLVDDICPHFRSKGSSREEQEEKRLLFVAMTRAKWKMYLLSTKTKLAQEDRIEMAEPTPWLRALTKKSYIDFEPISRKITTQMEQAEDLALFTKNYLESQKLLEQPNIMTTATSQVENQGFSSKQEKTRRKREKDLSTENSKLFASASSDVNTSSSSTAPKGNTSGGSIFMNASQYCLINRIRLEEAENGHVESDDIDLGDFEENTLPNTQKSHNPSIQQQVEEFEFKFLDEEENSSLSLSFSPKMTTTTINTKQQMKDKNINLDELWFEDEEEPIELDEDLLQTNHSKKRKM
ncbi:hypothetical protein C9374_006341 [Naegleria lovaniensis]|uniref:DNA 3'-5' helicase n=1 Tax=Naegleria lovaniensis TaxID=51637 RepID=A0AA88GN50_NAELO|nr:uncharacterized protein C9374_006341 [Naegleria lovaniensis]KAG2381352.1 hypothetical protein C9374_006341 [Naegleria lovaniensis]